MSFSISFARVDGKTDDVFYTDDRLTAMHIFEMGRKGRLGDYTRCRVLSVCEEHGVIEPSIPEGLCKLCAERAESPWWRDPGYGVEDKVPL